MRSSLSPLSRLLKFKPNQLHHQWSKPTPLLMEQNQNLRRSHRNHIVKHRTARTHSDSTKNQRHQLSIRCFKRKPNCTDGRFQTSNGAPGDNAPDKPFQNPSNQIALAAASPEVDDTKKKLRRREARIFKHHIYILTPSN